MVSAVESSPRHITQYDAHERDLASQRDGNLELQPLAENVVFQQCHGDMLSRKHNEGKDVRNGTKREKLPPLK